MIRNTRKQSIAAAMIALLLMVVGAAGSFAIEGTPQIQGSAKALLSDIPADDYQIQPSELLTLIKDGRKPFVLDIRTAQEFKKNHLKGSYSLPWGNSFADKISNLPKGQTIYVLSWDGQMGAQCAVLLNLSGFTARYVNSGLIYVQDEEGYEAFMEKGMTVLPSDKTTVNPECASFIKSYCKEATTSKDPRFMNNLISERNLKAMMKKEPSSIYIVDVRRSTDFLLGHFKGSVSVPFGGNMGNEISGFPKDKKIIVVCYVAQNSGVVTAALRSMGYDAVSLNSGSVGLSTGF